MRTALRHAALVVFGYAAIFVGLFSPVLFGGRLLAPTDGATLFYPAFCAPRVAWTTLIFGGFPAGANPQSLKLYPLALVFSGLGFNAFVVSAYVIAASLMYAYVHAIARSRAAAFVAGAAYGMGGFFVGRMDHVGIVHGAAWIPLLLLAIEEIRRAAAPRSIAAGAAATALISLAGHPQVFVYALALAGAYALVRARGTPVGAWRALLASAAAVALGTLAASAQILPALHAAGESQRGALPYSSFVSFSWSLRQLPQLLFPWAYGGSEAAPLAAAYVGAATIVETAATVGTVALLLALGALVAARRDPRVLFFGGAALLSIALACGDETPLARALYHVPPFDRFRAPARFLVFFAVGASALAGLGLAALARADAHARRRAAAIAGGALAALLLAGALALPGGAPRGSLAIPMGFAVAGGAGLAAFVARPAAPRAALLAVLVVLDLGACGWFAHWRTRAPRAEALASPPPHLIRYRDELRASGQRLAPLFGLLQPLEAATPNLSRLWGIPSAGGYDVLMPRRLEDVLGINSFGQMPGEVLADEHCGLDLLAVRYLLVPTEVLRGEPDGERWRLVERVGRATTVLENRRALPRAWLVEEVLAVSPEQARAAIRTSVLPGGRPFDPRRTVLVEPPLISARVAGFDPAGRAEAREVSETVLEVRTVSRSAAFLVTSDTWSPGWTATVDGVPTQILRSDIYLRSLFLPPGEHLVRFVYRTPCARPGAAASALGLVAIAALALGRGSRPNTRDEDPYLL